MTRITYDEPMPPIDGSAIIPPDRALLRLREENTRLRVALSEIADMEAPTYALSDATERARITLMDRSA